MIPKYRAYEKATGKMHKVVNLYLFDEELDVEYFNSHLDSPYENDTKKLSFADVGLMQYTGLKDKNGVEIYEGDIMQTDYETLSPFNISFQARVVFVDGCFCYRKVSRKYGAETKPLYRLLKNIRCSIKVIGNIYENPELLKDNK